MNCEACSRKMTKNYFAKLSIMLTTILLLIFLRPTFTFATGGGGDRGGRKRSARQNDELCFAVVGDIGGLPKPPYQTFAQKKVANLLAKVKTRFLFFFTSELKQALLNTIWCFHKLRINTRNFACLFI